MEFAPKPGHACFSFAPLLRLGSSDEIGVDLRISKEVRNAEPAPATLARSFAAKR